MTSTPWKLLVARGTFVGLAVVAIFETFGGSTEPVVVFLRRTWIEPYLLKLHNGNSIGFNLAIGFLISVFFWWLVVYLPERSQRAILRNNLRRRYREFKESTISTLLSAASSGYNSELPAELCDHRKFRAYFDADDKAKWYDALNGMERRPELLGDLLMEMQILADEISYVLSRVNIDQENVHAFFKRLNDQIYRLKNSSVYSYEPVKYVSNFIWQVHARWNFIDGQLPSDAIEDMIQII
jgi:hypothetical protein